MQHRTRVNKQELLNKIVHFSDCVGILFPIVDLPEYDPYFSIPIDVLYKKNPPSFDERKALYPQVFTFEKNKEKDRFLYEDLPVHINYKSSANYEALIKGDWTHFYRDSFALRRLVRSDIAHDPKSILDKACEAALKPPLLYWQQLSMHSMSHLEHCVEDIQAGIAKDDLLFVSLATSHGIEAIVKVVFALNKAFLPSPKFYASLMLDLNHQYEGFTTDFNNMLLESSARKKAEQVVVITKLLIKYMENNTMTRGLL